MAAKHSTRGWNLKKCAKRVIFKTDFAVFWARKEVIKPTIWVQNRLGGDQRALFIIQVGSNANGPLNSTQTGQKGVLGAIFDIL